MATIRFSSTSGFETPILTGAPSRRFALRSSRMKMLPCALMMSFASATASSLGPLVWLLMTLPEALRVGRTSFGGEADQFEQWGLSTTAVRAFLRHGGGQLRHSRELSPLPDRRDL